MAGDKHAFSLGQQVTDKIPDRVSFSGARRTLNQHASVLLQLLCDSHLLWICGLAQKDFGVRLMVLPIGWRTGFSKLRHRRFLSNNVQERPGQVFANPKVRKDTFDSSGETQVTGAQK